MERHGCDFRTPAEWALAARGGAGTLRNYNGVVPAGPPIWDVRGREKAPAPTGAMSQQGMIFGYGLTIKVGAGHPLGKDQLIGSRDRRHSQPR